MGIIISHIILQTTSFFLQSYPMPGGKSRRSKMVSLTQVKKKGFSLKTKIINRTRTYLKQFKYCYVFEHENMTTVPFREMAETEWADSKFQLGKNKVIGVALGRNEEKSYKTNSWKISE